MCDRYLTELAEARQNSKFGEIPDPEACGFEQGVVDDEEETAGAGYDHALKGVSVDSSLNLVAAASEPKLTGGEMPFNDGVKRHLGCRLVLDAYYLSSELLLIHYN